MNRRKAIATTLVGAGALSITGLSPQTATATVELAKPAPMIGYIMAEVMSDGTLSLDDEAQAMVEDEDIYAVGWLTYAPTWSSMMGTFEPVSLKTYVTEWNPEDYTEEVSDVTYVQIMLAL